MKNFFFGAMILMLAQYTYGQNYRLFPEMEISSLMTNTGQVELKNGEKYQGDLGLTVFQTSSGLQRISAVKIFKKGEKDLKFKIKDIKEVRIDADLGDESNKSANSGDGFSIQLYKEIQAEYYIFRNVQDKKGKDRLLQLLNPGFEDLVQVYVDPKAKDKAILIDRGQETAKSYYIVKTSTAKEIYVKKSKYKKMFADIFGDCQDMMNKFAENIRWKDFAQHIVFYEESCE